MSPSTTQPMSAAEKDAQDAAFEAEFVKGCPALLIPNSEDWHPTQRDLDAPQVLPARTFVGKLRTMFAQSAGKPLKVTPGSFDRPAPPPALDSNPLSPTYSPFAAFYLPGSSKKHVQEGFEPRYPARIMVDHDVSAVDWDRFLVNIRVAGALRGHEHLIANVVPAPLIVLKAAYGNYFITKAIMNAFKKRHIPEVLALVETYQHRFFQPRGLDVFVAIGTRRISGHFPGDTSYIDAPPVELGMPLDDSSSSSSSSFSSGSSSSSSSDSSDSDDNQDLRRLPKEQRKQILAERKAAKGGKLSKRQKKKLTGEQLAHARERRKQIKQTKIDMIERRRIAIGEEQGEGFKNFKKHGKYRIVVQPQLGAAPQPGPDWVRKMEAQEKRWGRQQPAPLGMEAADDLES